MPLWLQAVLVALFWMVFWPTLLYWAHRESRGSQRPRVQDLYPPRIHASQLADAAPLATKRSR